MKIHKKISIVIPVYNEQDVIPELIKQLTQFINDQKSYIFEVMLVENGSADQSFYLLQTYAKRDKRIKILRLSKNIGTDEGIAAGLRYISGDACVMIMADLEEPIDLISKFLEKWEAGYEIVYGIVKKRSCGIVRSIFSRMYYILLNLLTHNAFPENVSDFRLLDKKVYETIRQMEEQNKYLRGLIMWTGFSHTGIPFNREKRHAGKSKANLSRIMQVALNGIFSFSYVPLRLISYFGITITFVSTLLILFYLILFIIYGRETPGVTTIILFLLLLFGTLFFTLGIISEYLARIYDEVKRRPNFIVREVVNITPNK